jgi:hypothetical protein
MIQSENIVQAVSAAASIALDDRAQGLLCERGCPKPDHPQGLAADGEARRRLAVVALD